MLDPNLTPPPPPDPQAAADPQPRRADAADLPGELWEDVQLPFLNVVARVRLVPSHELVRLSQLPDLLNFAKMGAALVSGDQEDLDKVDADDFAQENYLYESAVAHLAILAGEDLTPVPCDECGFKHPASLWTRAQTAKLQPRDLEAVSLVALRGQSLRIAAPFSEADPPSGGSTPATSGASTQPTSS